LFLTLGCETGRPAGAQSTKLELAVNLKTAKLLGIELA